MMEIGSDKQTIWGSKTEAKVRLSKPSTFKFLPIILLKCM